MMILVCKSGGHLTVYTSEGTETYQTQNTAIP